MAYMKKAAAKSGKAMKMSASKGKAIKGDAKISEKQMAFMDKMKAMKGKKK